MSKINNIIIVQHLYSDTTAKTQRMLAAAKVYKKNGVNVTFVISSEDPHPNLSPEFKYIHFQESNKNKFRCFYRFVKAIKNVYTSDSAILFDGDPLYAFLFKSTKYHSFSEITEIPYFGNEPTICMRIIEAVRLYGVKQMTGIQVISHSLEDYFRNKGIKHIEIINMFVDDSRFQGLHKSPKYKYIGYCGTISLYKDGVHILLQAFSIFSEKHPDYKLVLIGGFESSEVETTIRNYVTTLKLQEKVFFTGKVNSTDMPQLLLDAEILALARPNNRQAQFGFPTKLGEYLATGNPVVVTKVGDIPRFLRDQENAYLTEPDNIQDFATKLDLAASVRALEIGKHGQLLIRHEFSCKEQSQKSLAFMRKF